jgi:DNA modification methylase
MQTIDSRALRAIRKAAADDGAVAGLTHTFYRYPARFSPLFVASAIEHFSREGDLILDPYMGGGTTIVEALARRRAVVGCDLNSLAVFVARAKTTTLTAEDKKYILAWSESILPTLSYHSVVEGIAELVCPVRTKNLSLPRARPAKKLIALALLSLKQFPSMAAQDFARAVLLNIAQWALNNRKRAPSLSEIRARIPETTKAMLSSLEGLCFVIGASGPSTPPILIHGTAQTLPLVQPFVAGAKANLVVTSPPYPGIHLLYHRWQVDGRKETPAPYWIADCYDGKGASFYNFAGREEQCIDEYFAESLLTLRAIRKVLKDGGVMIQMIAFSEPRVQLARYLANMRDAGFEEIRMTTRDGSIHDFQRIWRDVPGRAWHAAQKGKISSSREVVLIHRAA